MSQPPAPIVAFAPLPWTEMPVAARGVLARLAKSRPVFVLEAAAEPLAKGGRESWELSCGAPDLLVCRPRVANPSAVATSEKRSRMAQAFLHWLDIDAFVAWLYAPADVDVVRTLSPSLVIHDRSLESAPPLSLDLD
jgi:hypothetical protein